MAEFNYKIMHQILSCNYNLKKWGISDSDKCDVCYQKHDILHLVFTCVHSQKIWHLIQNLFDIDLNETNVIMGTYLGKIHNFIITVISFTIYKEWIICRDAGILRRDFNTRQFFINELYFKIKIYNSINTIDLSDIVNVLETIMYSLESTNHF